MIPLVRFFLLAWLLLVFAGVDYLSMPAQAQPLNMEAAKREGKVVVYGTVVPQSMHVITKSFEQKYGIKVEYWRGSATKVADRALVEWRADRSGFDVLEGNPGLNAILKKAGGFTKYIPPSSEKFPEQFREKDGLMTVWRVIPLSILYNTELVSDANRPRSLDDLIDPKWKGKITIPDPTRHAQTAEFFWNLQKLRGERWLEFVKALAKQEPHLVESFAPVPSALSRGEAHVGLGYIKYVKQFKGPFTYALLDRYLTIPNVMSLAAKAANPHAARLFMEYVCSPEGQKMMAEEGEFVLFPGIYPPIKDADKVVPHMVFMDNPTAEEFKKLRADFRQIFFTK
jgi:iron(III) transport system substrate-binding protein